jgi:hypothetical protein
MEASGRDAEDGFRVVTLDPEPERMPTDDESVDVLELVIVTGWRVSR